MYYMKIFIGLNTYFYTLMKLLTTLSIINSLFCDLAEAQKSYKIGPFLINRKL